MFRLIGCGKHDCTICEVLHPEYENPLRMPIQTHNAKKDCDPDTLITMWETLTEWAQHVRVTDYKIDTVRAPVWKDGHLSGWRHGLMLISDHHYKRRGPKKLIEMDDTELRGACS